MSKSKKSFQELHKELQNLRKIKISLLKEKRKLSPQ